MNPNIPDISGSYVYRSLQNNTDVNTDFDKLEFGRGVMSISNDTAGVVSGQLDMGSGYLMTLEGSLYNDGKHIFLSMVGNGVAATATAGWIYEYYGLWNPTWPMSIDQVNTITGSVLRAVDHNGSKAGVTCTFYMALQPPTP
jgi:hypothetical protein